MNLIFFSLLSVCYSSKHVFIPKNEYSYRFNGFVYSGLNTSLETETAQSRINAIVYIQAIDNTTINLRFGDFEVLTSQGDVAENIPVEVQIILGKPVFAKFELGLVTDLQFDSEDIEWSKNFKRSILNMVSLAQQEATIYESVVMDEKTIEGECQVLYTVNQDNKTNQTVINKSINFKKCKSRPVIIYGEQNQDNVNVRTDYTYILKDELLKRVEFKSIYLQHAKTVTYSRLVHIKTENIKMRIRKVHGGAEDLIYSTRMEKSMEDFFKNGDDAKENPFENTSTYEKICSMNIILRKIEKDEKSRPFQLVRFVRFLRSCTFGQLDEMFIVVKSKNSKKFQDIIENALSIAGTKNTIEYLIYLIHKETVTPFRASFLLKSIQTTLYPSTRIADSLVELANSRVSKNSELLCQSAWFASGAVVHGIISQKYHLINENTYEVREKYMEVFMKHYHDSESTYEKIIALKALGNTGITNIVEEMEEIIKNEFEPSSVRETAIESLRLLDNIMPHKLRRIFLQVFKNQRNAPQLRMTALRRIMHTQPTKITLLRIVSLMENEMNQRVKRFTYHHLNQYSKNLVVNCSHCQTSLFDSILQAVAPSLNFEQIKTFQSFIPKQLLIGLPNVQFGFTQQNIDKYLKELIENHELRILPYEAKQRFEVIKEIMKMMHHRSRNDQETGGSGFMYLRLNNMDSLVVPIDEQSVNNLLGEYIQTGFDSFINQPIDQNIAAYFHETEYIIPTTSGLPITISAKTPTMISIDGCIKNFQFNLTSSIASSHFREMSIRTPLFKQGVNTVQSLNINAPLRFGVETKKSFAIEIHGKLSIPTNFKAGLQWSSCSKVFAEIEDKFILIPQEGDASVNVNDTYRILGLEIKTLKTVDTYELNFENTNKDIEMESSFSFVNRPFNIVHFMKTSCYRASKSVFGLQMDDLRTLAYENSASLTLLTSVGHKMTLKLTNHHDNLNKYSLWDIDFHQSYLKLGYQYIVRNIKSFFMFSKNKISLKIEWESTPYCLPNVLILSGVLGQSPDVNETSHHVNQLRIIADYKLDQSTRRIFEPFIHDYLRILHWGPSINEQNRMYMNFTVDPNTRRNANISLQTCLQPNQQVVAFDIPEIQLPTTQHSNQPFCEYSATEIYTFDEHVHIPPQTTCNTLVTGIEGEFKVSIEKKWKNSKKITVIVNLEGDIFTLSKLQDFYSVRHDDQILSISDYSKYKILISDENIFFDINYCLLEYDGVKLRVQPKLYSEYKFEGMCGNIGERENSLRKPSGNLRIFVEENDDCETSMPFYNGTENEEEDDEDYEENVHEGLDRRTENKEFAYKICFSMEGVPYCQNSYEELETIREDVKYTCFARHDSVVRTYMQEIQNGTILRLDGLPISIVEILSVPTKCTHNNDAYDLVVF